MNNKFVICLVMFENRVFRAPKICLIGDVNARKPHWQDVENYIILTLLQWHYHSGL